MAEPHTWTVVQGIKAALQVITEVNGYHTDAGPAVTDEPGQVSRDASIAVGIAFIGNEKAKDPAVLKTHRLAQFAVVAKTSASLTNAQITLHNLVADIEAAMLATAAQMRRFPSGIQFPQFVKTEVIPPVEGSGWIGARVFYETHVPIA